MTRSKALALRALIVKAAESLSDTDALDGVELFEVWKPDTQYELDKRIRYGEDLYRVVQAHTSQADWTPDITPALYTKVAEPGEIPVWVQPTGAQDSYMAGDKVWFPEKDTTIYVNTVDYNVYAPDVYGWEVWTGD